MTGATTDTEFRLEIHHWDNCPDDLRLLRQQVFVEEQAVPADMEWDATDSIAEHFLVRDGNGRAVAVGRLYADGTGDGRIGRMAVARDVRKSGVGLWLLRAIMAHGSGQYRHLMLSAQEQAIPFYQRAGFVVYSDRFDEAGIPHRSMHCTAPGLVLRQQAETTTPLHLGQDTTSWQLETDADWNAALDSLSCQAQQRLWLFEPSLDRGRYDREFLRDSLSRLARRSRYSEIRLLVADDRPLVAQAHRMTDLLRRLSSHVHLRLVNSDYPVPESSFALVDQVGVAYRHQSSGPGGFVNFNAPARVKQLSEPFQQMWEAGQASLELRDLPL